MFGRIFYEYDGRVILDLEVRNKTEYDSMVSQGCAWVEKYSDEPRGFRAVPLASRAVGKIVSIDGVAVSL